MTRQAFFRAHPSGTMAGQSVPTRIKCRLWRSLISGSNLADVAVDRVLQ
jgi:hypothetical protein